MRVYEVIYTDLLNDIWSVTAPDTTLHEDYLSELRTFGISSSKTAIFGYYICPEIMMVTNGDRLPISNFARKGILKGIEQYEVKEKLKTFLDGE